MEELKKLIQQAKDDFSKVSELSDLDHVKSKYLGKQGPLTEAMKGLSGLPSKEKPIVGSLINDIKKSIEKALGDRKTEIQVQLMNDQLKNENIDVTLSGKKQNNGTLHPISITIKKIESIFNTIGFSSADGPEIEDDYHNFTALNIPESHPARAMHDTFYLNKEYVLRTHTSSVQIRYMENNPPPLRIISPGRVYRVDSDATHSPMFHQIEGLWIDKKISFANLKWVTQSFLQKFF